MPNARLGPLDPRSLNDIVERFLDRNVAARIAPLGAGLINATYRVDSNRGSFVLQRINPAIFPAPERIMANLLRLQAKSDEHPELGIRLPELIAAADGQPFVRDRDGGVWRLMEYIHGSRTLSSVQNRTQAAEIGRALGRFHQLGAELKPDDLDITLPGFHHTPSCLHALDAALNSADSTAQQSVPRDEDINQALAFIAARRPLVHCLEDALGQGLTRIRVIHGDPKLDNLLFHESTDQALCLIDLDTVQPGLIQHDIGDCLRSCCKRVCESDAEADPSTSTSTSTGTSARTVQFDLDICGDILDAYAQQVRRLVSPAEVELIYPAIRLIPLELGLRFLTDHLQGDRYFRVAARGENLRKAGVQFALVADIERQAAAIETIVRRIFGSEGQRRT